MKVTFLTQAYESLGGTDPIVIPTPYVMLQFLTMMFSEQVAFSPSLCAGFTATASSKLMILIFSIRIGILN